MQSRSLQHCDGRLVSQAAGKREWSPPEGWHVEHEGLAAEMHVGGVYLRLYMRNPQYPLRHPKTFLEVGHTVG